MFKGLLFVWNMLHEPREGKTSEVHAHARILFYIKSAQTLESKTGKAPLKSNFLCPKPPRFPNEWSLLEPAVGFPLKWSPSKCQESNATARLIAAVLLRTQTRAGPHIACKFESRLSPSIKPVILNRSCIKGAMSLTLRTCSLVVAPELYCEVVLAGKGGKLEYLGL